MCGIYVKWVEGVAYSWYSCETFPIYCKQWKWSTTLARMPGEAIMVGGKLRYAKGVYMG